MKFIWVEVYNICRIAKKEIFDKNFQNILKSVIGREEMGTLQCFKVNGDGTIAEIKTEGALKEKLNTEECFIIVSEEHRKVYFWKGYKSNVRSKFNGPRKCLDIRRQLGMDYRIVVFDEGAEDSDFIKLIGGKTNGAYLRILMEEIDENDEKYSSWPYRSPGPI